MRFFRRISGISRLFAFGPAAGAARVQFETQSTGVQTISSDLSPAGPIVLHASGTQRFTLDPAAGVADVTSDFHGSDFPTPSGLATYDLYNTATVGTVIEAAGVFKAHYSLLFELKVTGGDLAGVVFETREGAIFEGTVASLPFPPDSVFGDPNRPDDGVAIHVKADPNGVMASLGVRVGDPAGRSSNRVVTTLGVVPGPGGQTLLGLGLAGAIGAALRRSR
jgi:hypothetical protein